MSGHVVSIVGVDAGFATCHSDAKFRSGTGQVRGEVKIQQLVSKEASVGVSATEEGPIAMILKPPFQISMSFSLKTSLSALFCIPCRMVAVVCCTPKLTRRPRILGNGRGSRRAWGFARLSGRP